MSPDRMKIDYGSLNRYPVGEVRTKVFKSPHSSSNIDYDQAANATQATPGQHIGTITFAASRLKPLEREAEGQGPMTSTGEQPQRRSVIMEPHKGTKFDADA